MLLAASAFAQEGGIAPLPPIGITDEGSRITPPDREHGDAQILTTHKKPVDETAPPPLIAPLKPVEVKPPAQLAAPKTGNYLPDKVPFGRATPAGPTIPEGPRTTVATPVVDVDAIEASEPAPPTPVAPEADPATQDPAAPTELTAPIFGDSDDSGAPRKIVIRVLNKVTGQSTLFKAAPRETVKFGRLEITTVMCRTSAPTSQTDYAGLLDIVENLPGKDSQKKALFKGWMYASSPSISGLEHPIYDVTMVLCDIAEPAPKPEPKPAKKAKK